MYTHTSHIISEGWKIEGFHCIQRCPHFKVLEQRGYTVSSFQGVGIEEFHCIQRCPYFRVFELHCIQRCSHFRVLD